MRTFYSLLPRIFPPPPPPSPAVLGKNKIRCIPLISLSLYHQPKPLVEQHNITFDFYLPDTVRRLSNASHARLFVPLTTVEPRRTATPLIRQPFYYDHFFVARAKVHTFSYLKTPLLWPLRYYDQRPPFGVLRLYFFYKITPLIRPAEWFKKRRSQLKLTDFSKTVWTCCVTYCKLQYRERLFGIFNKRPYPVKDVIVFWHYMYCTRFCLITLFSCNHCIKSWLWPSLIRIKSVVRVGPLSLTHDSKVLGHFWHRLWHNFDSRQSYHAFDSSQRWAKGPLMHPLAIFDKTTFDSSQRCITFDSNQKWPLTRVKSDKRYGQIWPLTPLTYGKGGAVKAIFRAVDELRLWGWKITVKRFIYSRIIGIHVQYMFKACCTIMWP